MQEARTAHFFPALLLSVGVLLTLCSCSSTVPTGAEILKVNPYHLHSRTYKPTTEQMISFEYQRKTWGAVDATDLRDRYGNYFTVYWKVSDRNRPATVRLQYRQAQTGPKIFVEEIEVAAPKRTNTTEFKIVGDDYTARGAVTMWKASIIQGGIVVDETNSFLWQ